MAKVYILHYHLNPGGVTRVIESQVKALGNENVEIISGGGHQTGDKFLPEIPKKIIELLNYLPDEEKYYNDRYQVLNRFIRENVSKDDILHAHNLNLGKNPLLTLIISEMAGEGYKIINHVHDFAEDRPDRMEYLQKIITGHFGKNLKDIMYPPFKNYFFVALTSHDLQRLSELGVSEDRLKLLPNPVAFRKDQKPVDKEKIKKEIQQIFHLDKNKKIVTYPVRIIQRKNVGEFIFLATLFHEKAHWLVTQPPLNPVEVEPYNDWKLFCENNNIPVIFEAGNHTDFESLLLSSDLCFTTSLREGFGMVFLEPWVFGVPVAGRNIKHVTDDLIKAGISFPFLYDEINIRGSDFANLPVKDQKEAILKIQNDAGFKTDVRKDNLFLDKLLISIDGSIIERNKSVIQNEYSLMKYADRLKGIFKTITG